eukprot:XP_001705298.1 Hypothetical protein GL50803_4583 [Giardia lamblia ATCC 50803]
MPMETEDMGCVDVGDLSHPDGGQPKFLIYSDSVILASCSD